MSMFREYGITKNEFKAMQKQTEEENYLQFGFTLEDLNNKMTEDGLTIEDFTF